ncbi:hypothetical protein HVX72_12655 [Citrobacter sp. RHB21-C05]|uniref:hypothetical protein n=1 Tax=unclassified Citrobacter TaxID=2644389 RepID=UPI0015E969D5|nr:MULTISPECIES: hypothetical protein [unclassified Citrobacter]QMK46456.1 hypothetical protein HVX72_12655 [Citrobacter sp. RHB21-C05]QMK64899.1 hypothetical protein HVX68_12655 [Citrobacter sp. RHB21-C01]
MQSKNFLISEFKEWLQNLPELNIVNDATARNLRDSSLRLLTVLGPDGVDGDIRDYSVASMADMYAQSAESKPSDSSLQAYKSRMQSAVDKFIAYQNGELEGDKQIQPAKKERNKVASKKKTSEDDSGIKTFELPIPLRGELIVTIGNLPRDLTKEEAKRISLIVESFAMFDDGSK